MMCVVELVFNSFTAMMQLENEQQKCEISSLEAFLFSFPHWHVKGLPPTHIELKVDVL